MLRYRFQLMMSNDRYRALTICSKLKTGVLGSDLVIILIIIGNDLQLSSNESSTLDYANKMAVQVWTLPDVTKEITKSI